jgi:hypothetical protein
MSFLLFGCFGLMKGRFSVTTQVKWFNGSTFHRQESLFFVGVASIHDKIAVPPWRDSHQKRNQLPWKQVMAHSAILSITKLAGYIPSVSPFDKGG